MRDGQNVSRNVVSSKVETSDLILFPEFVQSDQDGSVLMMDAEDSETGLLSHIVIYYVTFLIDCTEFISILSCF